METGTRRGLAAPRSVATFAVGVLAGAATAVVLTMTCSRDTVVPGLSIPPSNEASAAELARLTDQIAALAAEVAALHEEPRTAALDAEGPLGQAAPANALDLESIRQLILRLMHEGKADAAAVEIQGALANKPEMDLVAIGQLYEQLAVDKTDETRRAWRFLSKRQVVERLGPPTQIRVLDDGRDHWGYAFVDSSGKERGINLYFYEGYVISVH